MKNLNFNTITVDSNNYLNEFYKSISARDGFNENDASINWNRVAIEVLGTDCESEEDYLLFLYELYQKTNNDIFLLNDELDKVINNEVVSKIQKILMVNNESNGLSVNRFGAFLLAEQLIPTNLVFLDHYFLLNSFKGVLKYFDENNKNGLLNTDFRRVFTDLIKWQNNGFSKWFENSYSAKFIWYGHMNKSQKYFVYYLFLIGCDILILSPDATVSLSDTGFFNVIKLSHKLPVLPFPKQKPKRLSTVAYRASKEINSVLHNEESLLYKPWQFRNYIPSSITLKTTYDEIFILAKEQSYIRPNFSAQAPNIFIPSLFSKINGVSSNKNEYWSRIHFLLSLPNSHLITSFPFTSENNTNMQYHYNHCLGNDLILDPNKIILSNWWNYKMLHKGLQLALANSISKIVHSNKIIYPVNVLKQEKIPYALAQLLKLPVFSIDMVQLFDYSKDIPKLIIFNNGKSGDFSFSDALVLLLLNDIGFDIIIYNTAAHIDIENYIDEKMLDIHYLEEISLNEQFKRPSHIKELFKNIFRRG